MKTRKLLCMVMVLLTLVMSMPICASAENDLETVISDELFFEEFAAQDGASDSINSQKQTQGEVSGESERLDEQTIIDELHLTNGVPEATVNTPAEPVESAGEKVEYIGEGIDKPKASDDGKECSGTVESDSDFQQTNGSPYMYLSASSINNRFHAR